MDGLRAAALNNPIDFLDMLKRRFKAALFLLGRYAPA
jgi:hypothetical protein